MNNILYLYFTRNIIKILEKCKICQMFQGILLECVHYNQIEIKWRQKQKVCHVPTKIILLTKELKIIYLVVVVIFVYISFILFCCARGKSYIIIPRSNVYLLNFRKVISSSKLLIIIVVYNIIKRVLVFNYKDTTQLTFKYIHTYKFIFGIFN